MFVGLSGFSASTLLLNYPMWNQGQKDAAIAAKAGMEEMPEPEAPAEVEAVEGAAAEDAAAAETPAEEVPALFSYIQL